MKSEALLKVYQDLFAYYGARGWWPADSPFEVMVGAVLTQNTSWTNVEKALKGVREATSLEPAAILGLSIEALARALRPVGYYNVKAKRLHSFCRWLLDQGGEAALNGLATPALRDRLLAVDGIGPETADDILLYAFHRPVFVIDAYTRRLFGRLGLAGGREPYEQLRADFEQALPPNAVLYGEYHALIVEHAKTTCRARPLCASCVLQGDCAAAG